MARNAERRWQVRVTRTGTTWTATGAKHTPRGDTIWVAHGETRAAAVAALRQGVRAGGEYRPARTFWDIHRQTVEEYSRAMSRSAYDARALEDAHIAWMRLLRAMRETVIP